MNAKKTGNQKGFIVYPRMSIPINDKAKTHNITEVIP